MNMNNGLIKVDMNQEKLSVSAHDLYEALEVKSRFNDWIKKMLEFGFVENKDYILVTKKIVTNNPKNPYTTFTDYQLSISTAKELCMVQRNDKGREFRKYFIQIEEEWNSPEKVMARALKMADKQIDDLKMVVKQQEALIEEQKPKTIFADAVASSHTSILIGDLAKLICQNGVQIGQRRLFEWLRENGYLIKRKGSDWNMPTQRAMEMGLFEIKESTHIDGNGCNVTTKTPKATGKGQIYFINKFLKGQTA